MMLDHLHNIRGELPFPCRQSSGTAGLDPHHFANKRVRGKPLTFSFPGKNLIHFIWKKVYKDWKTQIMQQSVHVYVVYFTPEIPGHMGKRCCEKIAVATSVNQY
jgi:hypothetical protein